MRILAIETSCDDTGVAILEVGRTKSSPDFRVLSNIVASQIEVHKQYGGVYPFMAKREHEKNLAPALKEALLKAKVSEKNIDLIAVTNGPGLEPCLWVGVNFAKDLAKKLKVPLIPINHIEAHILVNFLNLPAGRQVIKKINFPAIALVVSGGHTQLILLKKIGNYKILGETRDDAAGECFDKCAKIMGLGYPGGPIISELAKKNVGSPTPHKLPRPMMHTKDYDFSFSGLKTAVLYAWQKGNFFATRQKTHQAQIAFAAEIQQAIIDVLIKKTMQAVEDYKAKTLILGGGVSANQELREQFAEAIRSITSERISLLFPPANLSTDNALMTAITAYFHQAKKIAPSKLKANANLRIAR